MSGQGENPDDVVTLHLCEAYRAALSNEIQDVKKSIDKLDSRLWALLAGTILTVILAIVNLVK